jgi:hypothetical protein
MDSADRSIDYQWNRSEYLAVRRTVGYQPVIRIVVSISAVALLIAALASSSSRASYLFSAIALAYCVGSSWQMPISLWKRSRVIKEPYKVLFDEDGITLKTALKTTAYEWPELPYSTEWSDYFRLRKSRFDILLTIPKRGFHSSIDEERFRELLRNHTKAISKSGFLLSERYRSLNADSN